jgi:cysteine-S-conjugate beta-lyase
MKYNFDEEIDHRGINSIKWEFAERIDQPEHLDQTNRSFGEDRVLPMWVADMDFRSPEPVVDAIVRRVQNGVYGYAAPTPEFFQSILNWMKRRHEWEIQPDWICVTPGVVLALNMLVRTFVPSGGRVLIQPPVYHPFSHLIEKAGAVVATNPLIYEAGRYRMDLADLERKVRDPDVSMLILCSPHNPVGRVWTRNELERLGEICLENDVLVVSDEIHGDLVFSGHRFTPFAGLGNEFAQRSVICTAPSKTFNMAGLQTSCIIVPNDNLRSQFTQTLDRHGLHLTNALGLVALQAAYDHGEEWLGQVLGYMESNLDLLEQYVGEHMPQIGVIRPEGTYLAWLDCRRLGLDDAALRQLMLKDARVYLDDGMIFGREGSGFQRINIACPRSVLAEALERMCAAVGRLGTIPE